MSHDPTRAPSRWWAEVALPSLTRVLDDVAGADPGAGALSAARCDWAAALPLAPEAASGATEPFAALAGRLGLDPMDRALFALALAPYLDERVRDRYRALQGSTLADRCSVGFALRLLSADPLARLEERTRFEPTRPLFRAGLLELEPAPHAHGDALLDQLLCASQRTVDLALGRPRLHERVAPYCRVERLPVRAASVVLPDEDKRAALSLVQHHPRYREALGVYGFSEAIPYGRGITLLFAGPSGTGKTLFARALAHESGRPLFCVRSDKLAEARAAVEPIVEALFHDAQLFNALVFFDECEGLFGRRGPKLGALLTELERFEGLAVLATNRPSALDPAVERRIVHRMEFSAPDASERGRIWRLHLPAGAPLADDVELGHLAHRYELSGGGIKNAALVALHRAVARDPGAPEIDAALLREAAESQTRSHLAELAVQSRVRLSLEHLVLPEAERATLDEILSACRHRERVQSEWGFGEQLVTGKGISVLFDGPPGTGKTLCAELLARELRLPLYRVHIPNVVSKWVGETEKNIAEIFARARAAHSVLLFDEADSLFSKRTEARTANDRYANQEVNLLLQEIERYEGVVVLTTNLFSGLDDALKRRIQFRITFPAPGPEERARLWRTLVPARAPLADDVDFEWLGQSYPLSGGHIKNAILRAAYRAAAEGGALTTERLAGAALRECEAAEILVQDDGSW